MEQMIDAHMGILDAHAKVWSLDTGRPWEEWYSTHLAETLKLGKTDPSAAMPLIGDYAAFDIPAGETWNAATTFLRSNRAVISAFSSANLNDFIHEIGHVFFEDTTLAQRATLNESYADFAKLKVETVNMDDLGAREWFSDTFVDYISKKVAPTPALAKIFDLLSTWISEVWRAISGKVPDNYVPAKMKKIYDDLLYREPPPAPTSAEFYLRDYVSTGSVIDLWNDGKEYTIQKIETTPEGEMVYLHTDDALEPIMMSKDDLAKQGFHWDRRTQAELRARIETQAEELYKLKRDFTLDPEKGIPIYELDHASLGDKPIVLAMDLMGLKHLNKTSVELGDGLLRALVDTVKEIFPDIGLVRNRTGGDEFLIGAEDVDMAKFYADTIQEVFANAIVIGQNKTGDIEVHTGFHIHTGIGDNPVRAIDAAGVQAERYAAEFGVLRGEPPPAARRLRIIPEGDASVGSVRAWAAGLRGDAISAWHEAIELAAYPTEGGVGGGVRGEPGGGGAPRPGGNLPGQPAGAAAPGGGAGARIGGEAAIGGGEAPIAQPPPPGVVPGEGQLGIPGLEQPFALQGQQAGAETFAPGEAPGVTPLMPGFEQAYAPKPVRLRETTLTKEGAVWSIVTDNPEARALALQKGFILDTTSGTYVLRGDLNTQWIERFNSRFTTEGALAKMRGEPEVSVSTAQDDIIQHPYLREIKRPPLTVEVKNETVKGVLDEKIGQVTDVRRILSAWAAGKRTYVLANGTGTGKTYVALGTLAELNPKRAFVIVPNQNIATFWMNIGRETFGLDISNAATPPSSGIWVKSYAFLRENAGVFLRNDWDAMIFDESQSLKNYGIKPTAQADKSVNIINSQPEAKVLHISATPFQSLAEMQYLGDVGIWSMGRMGWERFLRDHNYNYIDQAMGGGYWRFDGTVDDIIDVYKQMQEMGIISQRELIMDVPLDNRFMSAPMDQDTRGVYNFVDSRFADAVQAAQRPEDIAQINAQRTIVLRRVMEMAKIPPAIDLAKRLLAEGKQVAVFVGYRGDAKAPEWASQRMTDVNYILSDVYSRINKEELKSVDWLVEALGGSKQVAQIHGGISAKMRDVDLDDYQTGRKKVLVATAAAGGTGLSLHDTVGNAPRAQINVYMPWSGQQYQQVGGRSYRWGSKTGVEQYWLFSDAMKEAEIAQVVAGRLQQMGAIVSGIQPSADVRRIAAFDFDVLDSDALKPRATRRTFASKAEPIGPYPPGAVEDLGAVDYINELEGNAWAEKVKPALNSLQEMMIRNAGRPGVGQDLSPTMREKMDAYLEQIHGDLVTTNSTANSWAGHLRDQALLNYSKRRGFDQLLSLIYPYEFWYTRTMKNWAGRFFDLPNWFANYGRLRNFQERAMSRPGYPTRFKGRVQIPMPFLPDWAGDSAFYDPLKKAFPVSEFFGPMDQIARDKNEAVQKAQYTIAEWATQGSISQDEAEEAIATKIGPTWERALSLAQEELNTGSADPLSFINTLMQPALYLSLPYFALTGKTLIGGEKDMPLLPITRTGKALQAITEGTGAQAIGTLVGGLLAAPETYLRKKAGLAEFGAWGDYYVDRQIVNIVADGDYQVKDGLIAMIERTGPVFEEARRRAQLEMAMAVPGALPVYGALHQPWKNPMSVLTATLFGMLPAGILPEGELQQRELASVYNKARTAYNAGKTDALETFFEKYPEYEARLALFDEPEERMRQFLISEVWDRYHALDSKLHKTQAKEQLGEEFSERFMASDYQNLSIDQLAFWSKALGGYAPKLPEDAGAQDIAVEKLEFAPEDEAATVDAYRKARNELFPNWYAIQAHYFGLQSYEEKQSFLQQFPQLTEYWDWNKSYKQAYPLLEKYVSQPEPDDTGPAYDLSFAREITAPASRQLFDYYMFQEPLTTGALRELQLLWQKYYPELAFQDFLDIVVRQAIAP